MWCRFPGHPMAWLCLLMVLLVPCSLSSSSDVPDFDPPLYNISLDLPPQQRWEPVLKHYNSTYLRELLTSIINQLVPKWALAVICPLAEMDLESVVREPYAGEIRGLSRGLGMCAADVLILNLAYEAAAFCTSIIAQDENGNIYHGRNMDYHFGETLRKITLDLNFVKDGQIAYTGTAFMGYVGLWTGQSPYKFTVSGNQRVHGDWWRSAVSAFLMRSSPVSWLMRDALNDAEDYQSAKHQLSTTPIIAKVYYIMAGTMPGEGVIITRDRLGSADILPLDPLNGEWFRVVTNYEPTTTPHPYDYRRINCSSGCNWSLQKCKAFSSTLDPPAESSMTHISSMKRS
ncbi:N-acylethanolamine-hydrolyzing acid amidase-like isoform X3 [Ascaphus truei]|uniref:N-acylethanolamine-hydrolyzing acid amidase-like isoform X3 n=1 Tax=Ascaphus truei TaxID=8439 RepID=UPI003F5A080D